MHLLAVALCVKCTAGANILGYLCFLGRDTGLYRNPLCQDPLVFADLSDRGSRLLGTPLPPLIACHTLAIEIAASHYHTCDQNDKRYGREVLRATKFSPQNFADALLRRVRPYKDQFESSSVKSPNLYMVCLQGQ